MSKAIKPAQPSKKVGDSISTTGFSTEALLILIPLLLILFLRVIL